MPADWKLREVQPELARRYLRNGWWTDETLGSVLANGLARSAGHTFRIHSRTSVRGSRFRGSLILCHWNGSVLIAEPRAAGLRYR